jgi:hypothetical protein
MISNKITNKTKKNVHKYTVLYIYFLDARHSLTFRKYLKFVNNSTRSTSMVNFLTQVFKFILTFILVWDAPVVRWKSLFNNFSSRRSGRVLSTTPSQLVWNKALSPKECHLYSSGKEIAPKRSFRQPLLQNSFEWAGIGKAATAKNYFVMQ